MTDSVQVAIGVVDGKVVATWHQPMSEIVFDPKNAYSVGMHMARAAMEAHQGKPSGGELEFIAGEMAEVEAEVSQFNTMLFWSFAIFGLGLIAAILLQVRIGLLPLRRLSAGLAHVREGQAPRCFPRGRQSSRH